MQFDHILLHALCGGHGVNVGYMPNGTSAMVDVCVMQCVEVVLSMISDSLDAWRTRQYDYYQRVLNGIL